MTQEDYKYFRLHERYRLFRETIIAALKTDSNLKHPVMQYGRDAVATFDELFPEEQPKDK